MSICVFNNCSSNNNNIFQGYNICYVCYNIQFHWFAENRKVITKSQRVNYRLMLLKIRKQIEDSAMSRTS